MPDFEVIRVAEALRGQDPTGSLFGRVLRQTIDQLLDGQHTGRYRWDDLYKTEKTHAGTLVEINLQRAFRFADGRQMDYEIAGCEVDCKFSQTLGGWEIPPEAWELVEHICLVTWASDRAHEWTAGVIRARESSLGSPNRDKKRKFKRDLILGPTAEVVWVWGPRMSLQENVLLDLDPATVASIYASTSGAERVRQLFRLVQERRITRNVVATVARQEDYMKRVRQNGGARGSLADEGIVILGGDFGAWARVARELGLPIPGPGEFVSVRITPVASDAEDNRPTTDIAGQRWAIARPHDPVVSAPHIAHDN